MRVLSNKLVNFLAQLIHGEEGCRLKAYQDEKGVWTIGWGHTGNVYERQIITQDTADQLFQEDLCETEKYIDMYVKVPLNDNQFAALVSLVYNIGVGNFSRSTLLREVNSSNFSSAAEQFLVWDEIAGTKNLGLLKRRQSEKALFQKPTE